MHTKHLPGLRRCCERFRGASDSNPLVGGIAWPALASIGHLAVGLVAGRIWAGQETTLFARAAVAMTAVSFLPDADVIAFVLRIPYAHPFGHRGASHSFVAAAAIAAVAAVVAPRNRLRTAVLVFAVAASHGLLDTLTDGGLGVALLWPLSDARIFAPWRPIPVAPIGGALLSSRGAYVLGVELLYFAPVIAFALWPRRAADAATLSPPGPNDPSSE